MSSTVAGALKQDASDVERTLTSVSSTVAGALKQDAGEVEQTLTRVSSTVAGALKQEAADAEQTLTRVSGTVGSTLRHDASEAEQLLTRVAGAISSTLRDSAGDIEQKLTLASATVGTSLKQDAGPTSSACSPPRRRGWEHADRAGCDRRAVCLARRTCVFNLGSDPRQRAGHRAVAQSSADHHHRSDPFERAGRGTFARQPVASTTEAIRTGAHDAERSLTALPPASPPR